MTLKRESVKWVTSERDGENTTATLPGSVSKFQERMHGILFKKRRDEMHSMWLCVYTLEGGQLYVVVAVNHVTSFYGSIFYERDKYDLCA